MICNTLLFIIEVKSRLSRRQLERILCCSEPMNIVYFEEAIDYLIQQKTIKSDKGIGVCGISKGAEVSLAMAAALPSNKLGAVAVLNALVSYSMVDVFYKKTKLCNCKFVFLNPKIRVLKVDFFTYSLEASFSTT